MRLAELLAQVPEAMLVRGNGDVEISKLTADSRQVETGTLFAAFAGVEANGEAYIPMALAQGAAAVLTRPGIEVAGEAAMIEAELPRRAFARLAAAYFAPAPAHVIAITGTDGKTSTAEFIRQLLEGCELPAASLGTLGMRAKKPIGGTSTATHTTPDPVALHRMLAEIHKAGITHVALEASSHGLDQFRLDGLQPEVGVFTTIGRDHLDYHADEDAYFKAKARLFEVLLSKGALAVLNAGAPRIAALAETAKHRGLEVKTFGRVQAHFQVEKIEPNGAGQRVALLLEGKEWQGQLPLFGDFQVMNVLAALAAANRYVSDTSLLLSQLPRLQGVPGRLELVGEHPVGAHIFVDYAHTPLALENALRTLRAHTQGQLKVVFGCGGNRDAGKRPLMGQIAVEAADQVIVTDDNPRNEDPTKIRQAILAAAPGALEIGDREEAISYAVKTLRAGDVLLIAGKGHETYQLIGDKSFHFNDAEVARAALGVVRAGPARMPA